MLFFKNDNDDDDDQEDGGADAHDDGLDLDDSFDNVHEDLPQEGIAQLSNSGKGVSPKLQAVPETQVVLGTHFPDDSVMTSTTLGMKMT